MDRLPDTATLGEARQRLRDGWLTGVPCDCCGQFVRLYRRGLTSGMTLGMIAVYRATRDGHANAEGFVHAEDTFRDATATGMRLPSAVRGDWAKLRFWGMAEQAEGNRADGSPRNGHWRLTEKGRLFVEARLAVPAYVWLYNNRQYDAPDGADGRGETTTIRTALGNAFDFNELMNGGTGAAQMRAAA